MSESEKTPTVESTTAPTEREPTGLADALDTLSRGPGALEKELDAAGVARTDTDTADDAGDATQQGVTDGGSLLDSAKMVITVTLVAAISAGLLGFVYSQTKPRIEQSRLAEKVTAFGYILPAFDNEPIATECAVPLLDADTGEPYDQPREGQLFTATSGGAPVGYALQLFTTEGFGPRIDVIVGAKPDGAVTGVYVLNHTETPGLGAKVTDSQTEWGPDKTVAGAPYLHQFENRAPAQGLAAFQVEKDGGTIDSITASTITSRAVANAIADAAWTIASFREAGLPAGCSAAAPAVPGATPASEGGAR